MVSYLIINGQPLISAGVPPVSVSGAAPTAGMVITATDSNDAVWADVGSGTIVLGGDVTGAGNANTVVKVHGASIPTAGTTGNSLQVIGANALGYAAVNLAGGANVVSGVLPIANQANQNMVGDVTGNTGASIVAALQGNPVQSGSLSASQDGYVLSWVNGSSQWQARPAASVVVSGQDFNFANSSSDIGGYNQLLNTAVGSQQTLTGASSSGSKTLIKAFATPASNPNVDLIPAGLWEFNFYAFASLTGAFTTTLVFDVYSRTSGGSETLIFSAISGNIQVTSAQLYTLLFNQTTDTVIAPSSRIVIKVSAVSSNVVSTTVSFIFDGSTQASLVRTPISGAALQLGGDLSGSTASASVLSITGNSSNEFTSSGTLANIVPTETVLASGTSNPVKGSVGVATTTDGTTWVTISSFTPGTNSAVDCALSFIATNTTTPGQFWRCDVTFTVARAGSAPTLYPSSPAAANIRNATISPSVRVQLSTNLVQIQVQGVASNTLDWSCILQNQVCV